LAASRGSEPIEKNWGWPGSLAQGISGDIELSPSRIGFQNEVSVALMIVLAVISDIILAAGRKYDGPNLSRDEFPKPPFLHPAKVCNEARNLCDLG